MADPITLGMAAGALGSIVQGIISSRANSRARKAYEEQLKKLTEGLDTATKEQIEFITKASEQLASVGIPPAEALNVAYERFKVGGQLTPETAAFVEMAPSEMAKLQEDPRLKQVRLDALARMQEQATRGLTPEIEAAIRQQQAGRAQELQSATQSILEQQAQRGTARSGGALLAQLNAAQQQANRASLDADRLNAMIFQNQNQATAQAEQLAGGLMREDFDRGAAKARAQDEISRLNNQLSLQARQAAAQIRNQAQAQNLAREQGVMDQNVGLTNREQDVRRQNEVDRYNMQMQQAQAQANLSQAKGAAAYGGARDQAFMQQGAAGQMANFEQQRGQIIGNTVAGAGTAIAGGLGQQAADDKFTQWLAANKTPTTVAVPPVDLKTPNLLK
jgi:hypothetical protein